jgi:methoxymalonate biosynthesis acyl carrier protein
MLNETYQVIQADLFTLFTDVMHVDIPSAQTDLFDSGILDSQKFVELLLHIEQKFHAQIDLADFEIENFRCVEKIAGLILRLQESHRPMQPS